MIRISQSCKPVALTLILVCGLTSSVFAASKPHAVSFGKWITVQWSPDNGAANEKRVALKVRPLLIDMRVKEFTVDAAHDVTDRLFVVRRAFRVNDSLPQESASAPHWRWQRGAWLLVDRATGHVSAINLPEFDVFYSAVSWYRDYAAYCGISDDGKKVYAVVAQISRRKPILKKPLGEGLGGSEPTNVSSDSVCLIPAWQRSPTRVTFEANGTPQQIFAIHGRSVDLVTEEEDDEEAAK